jgi:Cu/Ag efflux protein CusF
VFHVFSGKFPRVEFEIAAFGDRRQADPMKSLLRLITLGLLPVSALLGAEKSNAKNCGCQCCKGKEICCCVSPAAGASVMPVAAEAPRSHPLRGVVVAIDAARSELTVKHEAIPGVMRAMTMVFKVEPAAVKSVEQGQTITAKMSRRGDAWWLHEIKPAPAAKKA